MTDEPTVPPSTPIGLPARPDQPPRGDDRTRAQDDARRDADRASARPEGDSGAASSQGGAADRRGDEERRSSDALDLSRSVAGEEDPGAVLDEDLPDAMHDERRSGPEAFGGRRAGDRR